MGARFRTVVVGSLSLDVIERAGGRERRLGGVVTYAGLTYRRLGLELSVVFRARPEDASRWSPLADAGLTVAALASGRTTAFVNDSRARTGPRR